MSTFKDLTGQKFGRLTVLKQNGWYTYPSGKRWSKWLCLCECGKQKSFRYNNLTSGNTQSCGCYHKAILRDRACCRVDTVAQAKRHYYQTIKYSARKRGHSCNLTQKQILLIGSSPCHYCGDLDTFKKTAESYKTDCERTGSRFDQDYYDAKLLNINGIDRVDNDKGYVKNNVVSCCSKCNRSKFRGTQEEFLAWAKRLVAHQVKKDSNIVMGSIRG